MRICFVETEVFTRRIAGLGLEDELRQLQQSLVRNPEAGKIDAGTGGLRKVRMGDRSRAKGKRGAARVHYLHLEQHAVIVLVFVYSKGERAALTARQKKQLRSVAEAIEAEWRSRA